LVSFNKLQNLRERHEAANSSRKAQVGSLTQHPSGRQFDNSAPRGSLHNGQHIATANNPAGTRKKAFGQQPFTVSKFYTFVDQAQQLGSVSQAVGSQAVGSHEQTLSRGPYYL